MKNGQATMVNVEDKAVSLRRAVCSSRLRMSEINLTQSLDEDEQRELVATIRIAAIQAAKKTSELIPMCHPLFLDYVGCRVQILESAIEIECEARTHSKTGVEMEALVGASVGALTAYDMLKAKDPGAIIEEARLLRKEGGKAGLWESSPASV